MLKKCLRILFNIDNLIISIITTALLCGLLTIIKRLEFLDPVEKVVEELSMMEVYFHINNSGETGNLNCRYYRFERTSA